MTTIEECIAACKAAYINCRINYDDRAIKQFIASVDKKLEVTECECTG